MWCYLNVGLRVQRFSSIDDLGNIFDHMTPGVEKIRQYNNRRCTVINTFLNTVRNLGLCQFEKPGMDDIVLSNRVIFEFFCEYDNFIIRLLPSTAVSDK